MTFYGGGRERRREAPLEVRGVLPEGRGALAGGRRGGGATKEDADDRPRARAEEKTTRSWMGVGPYSPTRMGSMGRIWVSALNWGL